MQIMIVQIKQVFLFLLILHLAGQVVFSQDHKTRNNYKGSWETPASWDPTWPVPQNSVNNLDITINGYITANNSLSFSGASSKLIVDDTLVIIGNLTIDDDNDVQVNNNGILIVRGNLTISDHSKIEANNYIIVTGNIIKLGPTHDGKFTSDDDPVRVFVGGTISPANLTDNKPDYPALDCSSPNTTPYLHSTCSYGDMTDIIDDPIYLFFISTCATATLTSSDADNSFCAGTSVTFTAGGGTNYDFRVNDTSVQNGGSKTYTTSTLTNGSIVDVKVTGTSCSVISEGINNTVIAFPVAAASSDSPVCAGSLLTLIGGPEGMTTYTWTGPDGFRAATQSPTVSPAATVAMAGVYTLTITNGECTSTPVTTTVVVNALPIATATSNSPVCAGSPLTLTGGPAEMTSYSWTGPDGFKAGTQSPTVSPAANIAMAGVYTLTVSNESGCSNEMTQSVTVNENPIAIAGPDQELEFIFETQMNAELSSSETGEWSLISGSGRISDIHSPTSLVTELSSDENIFLWKVQNRNCEASDEVKITVHDLFVPSVITPDGDGKNDFFKISESIEKVNLVIFNRWGNQEYTNDDYKNDWDGRNNKGAELPADTYFYILKFENGSVEKGSVLIKR